MQVFAALADSTRAKIVEALAHRDLSAGEIAERFPVSRPAVSRHLSVLRRAGLVRFKEDAQRRIYSLNPQRLDEIDKWVAKCRRMWNQRLDNLERHLAEMVAQEREGGKR